MTTIPGARRMAIRVNLRRPHPRTPLPCRERGRARCAGVLSAPDVQVYRYLEAGAHTFPAPAAFRAVLGFRWIAAGGRVLRQLREVTPACSQPDERPKLVVDAVTATATPGSHATPGSYDVTLANRGRGPAAPFALVLMIGGAFAATVRGRGHCPRAKASQVSQTLPPHPRQPHRVQIDPGHHLQEAPAGGRPVTVACVAAP